MDRIFLYFTPHALILKLFSSHAWLSHVATNSRLLKRTLKNIDCGTCRDRKMNKIFGIRPKNSDLGKFSEKIQEMPKKVVLSICILLNPK